MKITRSRIVGVGSYLPERVVTNHELAQRMDTSDAWIVERSGIRERHIAAEGQFTSHLAIEASRKALAAAGMAGQSVDMIVLATATPDNTFPSTAARVQAALGMKGGAAFDVQAVCCGFMYALATADNFIKAGQARTALVIGAETFSRILDWDDRTTCFLFGDGAGAVVLKAETGSGGPDDHGILSTRLHADGSLYDLLYVDGGPSSTGTVGHVRMMGREVFRHAVGLLAEVAQEVLADNEIPIEAVDWLIPHQANRRIIDSTGRKLGLPAERVIVTIEKHGNTSAASIPLALSAAVADGRVKPGQLLLFEALGGGMAWGSALVRF